MTDRRAILKAFNLRKEYRAGSGFSRRNNLSRAVVNNVSLDIMAGECLALVGESGSGKTTFCRCLIRLIEADGGNVFYDGKDILQLTEKQFQPFRRTFQMIFQESAQALNPRQSVGSCLAEPLRVHGTCSPKGSLNRVDELLDMVGLDTDLQHRFPHQLSGGQRQRVAIARALTVRPAFLVADEPTSSLDASLKRKIIDLLQQLQRQMGLTLLLISHDIAMVSCASDRIAVMYNGELVELAPTKSLLMEPAHPYARLLLDAARSRIDLTWLPKDVQTSKGPRSPEGQGCSFSDRCPMALAICHREKPSLNNIAEGHQAACHLAAGLNVKSGFPQEEAILSSVLEPNHGE